MCVRARIRSYKCYARARLVHERLVRVSTGELIHLRALFSTHPLSVHPEGLSLVSSGIRRRRSVVCREIPSGGQRKQRCRIQPTNQQEGITLFSLLPLQVGSKMLPRQHLDIPSCGPPQESGRVIIFRCPDPVPVQRHQH